MRQKKPRRLIKYVPKGVPCSKCKHAVGVDIRHGKYYCINPSKKGCLYDGEHVCGTGESK